MLLLILFAFLAGVAITLSPCILPILPIMLSGAVGGKQRPYGIIVGFILSFSVFTLFIAAIVQALGIHVDVLRWVAAVILVLLGIVMVVPKLQEKLNGITGKLTSSKAAQAGQGKSGFGGGFLTGLTLGLVWTPCAGPILGAVITLAAASEAGLGTFFIVLAFALGTSLVMFLILLGSRKLLEKVQSINKHLETIHRAFGVLIILAGIGIGLGYDRDAQAWLLENTPTEYYELIQSIEESDAVTEELNELQGLDVPSDE